MSKDGYRTIVHKDGSVTYWSVTRQQRMEHVSPLSMSDDDFAALPENERRKVERATVWWVVRESS